MADVFLSYSRGDRAAAERLANAIADTGLSVWWDRHIKGGSDFSHDIEEQLESARRVLVLWSAEAVGSRWVRDEAGVAADTRRLVSATIDGTPPPLGFRQFHTIDLSEWSARGAAIPEALAEALDVEAPAPSAPATPARRRFPILAVAAAVILIAITGALLLVRPAPLDRLLSGERHDQSVALAIMPFSVHDGTGADYLGPGLSSALADSLAPLSGLKITASTSTQALAGKGLTAPEIAQRLGITHLVEGNVQKDGDRYSIDVRLIDARSSQQVWTRSFDGTVNELQRMKGQIARELAGALTARLGVGQGEIAESRGIDPAAYEAYLRALERVSVRDDRNARVEAIRQFRLAASIQPDFADAHAGYAYLMALSMPDQLGMSWKEIIAEQHRATARALQLDPDNPLALTGKAAALVNFEGEIDQSQAIVESVLKRSPNFGPARYSLASNLLMRGRAREALDQIDQAIERDPFDVNLRRYRARILYSLGDYQAVRDEIRRCDDCGLDYWFLAMFGYGTPEQYRGDFPRMVEAARKAGASEEDMKFPRQIADALIFGQPYTGSVEKLGEIGDFVDASLTSRLDTFDRALRIAGSAAQHFQGDAVVDMLNGGRLTFAAEQRADPRYHALFRHPKLAKIEAARRKEGVTAGLPVFPMKPYTGR